MIQLSATMNPDALEVSRDGKVIGTIRRDWPGIRGQWALILPESGDGAVYVTADVITVVNEFIANN